LCWRPCRAHWVSVTRGQRPARRRSSRPHPDGTIVRGAGSAAAAPAAAVLKAARDALADGEPRMVSVQPEKSFGRTRRQARREPRRRVRFAERTCAREQGAPWTCSSSRCCPHPSLVILGVSPVALSLATQARQLGYHVTLRRRAGRPHRAPDADTLIDGYALGALHEAKRFVVVSTQGKGDEAALRIAAATEAAYHAFVGSRRKMAALRAKLIGEGVRCINSRPHQGPRRPRPRRHHAGRDLPRMSILAENHGGAATGASATVGEGRSCRRVALARAGASPRSAAQNEPFPSQKLGNVPALSCLQGAWTYCVKAND